MTRLRVLSLSCLLFFPVAALSANEEHAGSNATKPAAAAVHDHAHHLDFATRSVASGRWSDPNTWQGSRVPRAGDRVLVSPGTRVIYDVEGKDVIRLVQIVGTLSFARDRNTTLNVGVLKVQNSPHCSESGFACDFAEVTAAGEPSAPQKGTMPALEVGTLEEPIPAQYTARIRLHYLEGMDKKDAPALVCCAARMELHGAPLSRTWVKLGQPVQPGDKVVKLSEVVSGWRVGDEVIVTASKRSATVKKHKTLRDDPTSAETETRRIAKIDGDILELDQPLKHEHYGQGEFRSEVANLSRNVIIESADPAGERGHTMYHAFSQGGISYARFAHLGKRGVLGRYAIHYHLVGDTMRGSQVLGAAIVDSHNRWITIHGTEYLTVRDCVGYRSIGHGYFMEDGTEVYNLLDRNLGVQAMDGRALTGQVLPFDRNEGAAFWWANGRNSLTRNVACENGEYGYRYDMKHQPNHRYYKFNSTLPITQPDGTTKKIDVRTIGIWRFDGNESHTENWYGLVVAANGADQNDSPVKTQEQLDAIRAIDWTAPDTQHPHIIRNLKIWEAHYAFRPHSPSMLMDGVRIDHVSYGIYRPAFDNQEFRNLHLSNAAAEPFNRGMDDAAIQVGSISIDGLKITEFDDVRDQRHPVVHMSDTNLSGKAEGHFRNVVWGETKFRRPIFNRGGTVRMVNPFIAAGVPYYIHDYYGPGRHAKIVITTAKDLVTDGNKYRQEPPLTGDESVVAEVTNVEWPKLLNPIDDLPPATIITQVRRNGDKLQVTGISHDNGDIVGVTVNGRPAEIKQQSAGVADWTVELPAAKDGKLVARATDDSGNAEQTGHEMTVGK